MIWTRIRFSPSNWGGLPGSVAPYMTYCFVRKCGFDCLQLPPHGNCLVNTYKELIVRTPYGCNALNRSRNTKFWSLRMKFEKAHKIQSLSYALWATSTWCSFLIFSLWGWSYSCISTFLYVAMVFILDPQREMSDRLHSVNLDMISDNHLKQLVIPCFGFLSLLYTCCLEQKWQTIE